MVVFPSRIRGDPSRCTLHSQFPFPRLVIHLNSPFEFHTSSLKILLPNPNKRWIKCGVFPRCTLRAVGPVLMSVLTAFLYPLVFVFTQSVCPFVYNYPRAYDLTLRRLMSYIYGAPILNVSRSHTTTQHSR